MKWGKVTATLTVKVRLITDGQIPDGRQDIKAPGHPSATARMGTTVNGDASFEVKEYVSFDLKMSNTQTINPDGSRESRQTGQGKSKSIVDAPLPD